MTNSLRGQLWGQFGLDQNSVRPGLRVICSITRKPWRTQCQGPRLDSPRKKVVRHRSRGVVVPFCFWWLQNSATLRKPVVAVRTHIRKNISAFFQLLQWRQRNQSLSVPSLQDRRSLGNEPPVAAPPSPARAVELSPSLQALWLIYHRRYLCKKLLMYTAAIKHNCDAIKTPLSSSQMIAIVASKRV